MDQLRAERPAAVSVNQYSGQFSARISNYLTEAKHTTVFVLEIADNSRDFREPVTLLFVDLTADEECDNVQYASRVEEQRLEIKQRFWRANAKHFTGFPRCLLTDVRGLIRESLDLEQARRKPFEASEGSRSQLRILGTCWLRTDKRVQVSQ